MELATAQVGTTSTASIKRRAFRSITAVDRLFSPLDITIRIIARPSGVPIRHQSLNVGLSGWVHGRQESYRSCRRFSNAAGGCADA